MRHATATSASAMAGVVMRAWCVPSPLQRGNRSAYVDGFANITLGHKTAVRPQGSRGGTG